MHGLAEWFWFLLSGLLMSDTFCKLHCLSGTTSVKIIVLVLSNLIINIAKCKHDMVLQKVLRQSKKKCVFLVPARTNFWRRPNIFVICYFHKFFKNQTKLLKNIKKSNLYLLFVHHFQLFFNEKDARNTLKYHDFFNIYNVYRGSSSSNNTKYWQT